MVRAGKGRKDRLVYLGASARRELAAWLQYRAARTGALFHPIANGGWRRQQRVDCDHLVAAYDQPRLEGIALNCDPTSPPHDHNWRLLFGSRRHRSSVLLMPGHDLAT